MDIFTYLQQNKIIPKKFTYGKEGDVWNIESHENGLNLISNNYKEKIFVYLSYNKNIKFINHEIKMGLAKNYLICKGCNGCIHKSKVHLINKIISLESYCNNCYKNMEGK